MNARPDDTARRRWSQVREILAEAVELRSEERAAWIDERCGDDVELRHEVDALLEAHRCVEGQGSFFGADDHPVRIGPYEILEPIGRGGMGIVYLAEQKEPIRRRVAIKLIRLGMDTREVISRFGLERQALALMDHPSIARVIDAASTEQGRPYFAMEYVSGVPITEYCDRHRLGIRARLELFTQVCAAVQHAHQKGVIHRDLKPSNVLVTVEDGRPLAKIIDFGIAKATGRRLSERTVFTRVGVLMGTPEYMSPEQAELTASDVDSRTDVYSLGVMLYELLAGQLPFDPAELHLAGFDEIRRQIREVDPPRPSVRLSSLPGRAKDAASTRNTDPGALVQELRGDLDLIIMKALEKERTRRYGSPGELAADLRRYLEDEPIIARPPSVGYRARKFARRNRTVIVSGALVAAALLLGLLGASVGLMQSMRSNTRAQPESAAQVVSGHAGAQKITFFPPHVYDPETAVMDARLGITGFVIEDFEDGALVPGLTIELTNPDRGPTNVLDNITLDETCLIVRASWDGPGLLVNTDDNVIWWGCGDRRGNIAERITFYMDPPVESFGVGFANMAPHEADHALFVNEIEVVSVLDAVVVLGDWTRDGYLRIDANPGQPIESVAFEVRDEGSTAPRHGHDGLLFDHVALGFSSAASSD